MVPSVADMWLVRGVAYFKLAADGAATFAGKGVPHIGEFADLGIIRVQ